MSLTMNACCFDSQNPVAWGTEKVQKTGISHGTSNSESRVQTDNKDQKQITGHIAVLACITRTVTMPLTEAGTLELKEVLMCLNSYN